MEILDALEDVVVPVVHEGRAIFLERFATVEPILFQPFVFNRAGIADVLALCRANPQAAELVREAVATEALLCRQTPERFEVMLAGAVKFEDMIVCKDGWKSELMRGDLSADVRAAVQNLVDEYAQTYDEIFREQEHLAAQLCELAEAPLIGAWQLRLLILTFVYRPAAWGIWLEALE